MPGPQQQQRSHVHEADQQRLYQVAFLGPAKNFEAPEALWLKGPSPSELREGCGKNALSWSQLAS